MKEDLLIITRTFFNKYGNQSFYESVIGYCKNFNVTIITLANLNDSIYYTIEEIEQKLPTIRIIRVRSKLIDTAKKILNKAKLVQKVSEVNAHTTNNPEYIKNSKTSNIKYFVHLIYNRMLYNSARNLIRKEKYTPKYICAYEIGGVLPAILLKKKIIPDVVTFGKFQGTVLGSVLDRLDNPRIVKTFRIEIHGMQHAKELDACIMTNDGTKGKDVLKHFLVADDNILFITNGIPSHLAAIKKSLQRSKKAIDTPINLFTMSRLIYWKRVDLAIEIMNNLVNELQDLRYRLNIYGLGSNQEINDLETMIKQYNLEEYVKIRGEIPFNRIFHVYHENDILLSLYLFSNLCNPVLEAMYLSKPIITIQQDDLTEVFKEPHNGLIMMNETDANRLTSAIACYLHEMSIQDIATLIQNCNEDRVKVLTWEERIKREIEFIRSKTMT